VTVPTPAAMAATLPLPRANFRAGRLRQVERLKSQLADLTPGTAAFHDVWARLVFARKRLAELDRPTGGAR
jgi:hypothetical protein